MVASCHFYQADSDLTIFCEGICVPPLTPLPFKVRASRTSLGECFVTESDPLNVYESPRPWTPQPQRSTIICCRCMMNNTVYRSTDSDFNACAALTISTLASLL
jgi:hypothetical protein